MAVPPTTEEAFIREVDEELRRDTLQGFWKKWGRVLIGATLGGLALFGGWLWWQERRIETAGKEGEELTRSLEALSAGNAAGAEKGLTGLAGSDVEGHRVLALLAQADLALQKGDTKKAAETYGKIAADADFAQPWRDLALVRQTSAEYESLKPDQVVARLKPLAVAGNPWFGSAGELTAMAYLKMGKPDLAGALFAAMAKDEKVPDTIRSRAVQMAGTLGVDAVLPATKADQ